VKEKCIAKINNKTNRGTQGEKIEVIKILVGGEGIEI